MPTYGLGRAEGEIALTYNDGGAAKAAQQDIDNVTKKSGSASAEIKKAGTAALVAGTAIAGGFALAVNSAANFEQRMSAVKAVSGASASEMDALRGKALQLGKDTAFSATEAALAMEELVKAGLSTESVLNGAADATVALAAAGEVSLPFAAEVASNAMNAFNLTAKDMPRVADLFAGAANASAIGVEELGQSLQAVGAVANTVGLSLDDTATAIGLLGNAGIKGSDAGTSLKTMFLNLQPQTDKQIELFEKLGLVTEDGTNKFFDAQGNLKDLATVSGILQKALKGQTKQQQLATLETLFGTDAIRAAAVLSAEGAKGVNTFAAAMGKVSAADVAAERMNNFKGSLEEMKGSLETAGIALGTILIPAVRSVADAITGLLNRFLNLDEGTQKIIAIVGLAVAAFLLFVGATIKIIFAINAVVKALAIIRAAMATTWLAALGPIALVIAAVVAIGAALFILWKKSETFRNIVLAVWNAIKTAALAVANWFTGPFVNFFVSLYNSVVGAFNSVKNGVSNVMNAIRGVITGILNTIKSAWATIWGTFGPLVRGVFNLIKSIIVLALTVIVASIKAQFTVAKAIITTVWNAVSAVTRSVWNVIRGVVTSVVNAIRNVISAVFNASVGIVRAAFNAINNAIGDKLRAAYRTVRDIVGDIRSFFSGAIRWLVSAGRDLIQGLINGIVSMGSRLLSKVTDMVNSVTSKIKSVFKIGSPSKVMKEIGKFVGQGLVIGVQKSASEVKAAGGEMAETLKKALEERLEKGKISKDSAKGLMKVVRNQKQALVQLAKDRDVLTEKIKRSRDALEEAIKVRADYAADVSGKAQDFSNITSIERDLGPLREAEDTLKAAQDALAEARREGRHTAIIAQREQAVLKAQSAVDTLNVPLQARELEQGLTERLLAINQFKSKLAHLISQGLNKQTYDELVKAGVETGTQYAQALIDGGPAAISNVNNLQSQIATAAGQLGQQSAAFMHDAGVQAARGLVQGLEDERADITKAMEKIARKMVKAIRKALKIKSPSRILFQQALLAIQGFVGGIEASTNDVYRAMTRLGEGVPTALSTAMPPTLPSAQRVASASQAAAAPTPGGPLIGTQNVWYPRAEPASQTAAREATRTAVLGRVG